ncbi:glycerol-3-phosphate 1-O-acyltransferase PlsY [Novosphingobium aquiterrae]|uniref:Glycerol-3-phosphate acyltransferase n=1 Tax=Novosphingobium aquiterrae TaxID=624388 RepID=A0ABV6PGI6_9SPHN
MDSVYALALGYLLGSIPFGLILTRLFGAGDLRSIGSGSIGATNVLRTGRKGLAAATLLLDAGKGALAVWIAAQCWPHAAPLAAFGAIVGHCFPVWLGFKGGKGVATALGIALALAWPVALACAGVWLAVVAVSRISSLGGMTAALAGPLAAWALCRGELIVPLAGIALVVLWRHRANIARLRAGSEPRIGQKG